MSRRPAHVNVFTKTHQTWAIGISGTEPSPNSMPRVVSPYHRDSKEATHLAKLYEQHAWDVNSAELTR
uniref:TonB-dependent outer membrane receptor n=1 Tax=Rubinisphaera brasiliensis (strain ATCC 49424 / DSM 5305 / JCM 21570 / IAM 15109 / NBRC 103401 / IFAM 1448) TaxID=756272 RepID=F0SJA6_RUBBR|nr:TonB-dependent outer membrane receptor [Rubinisphaera brasiliensis DSM 5305]